MPVATEFREFGINADYLPTSYMIGQIGSGLHYLEASYFHPSISCHLSGNSSQRQPPEDLVPGHIFYPHGGETWRHSQNNQNLSSDCWICFDAFHIILLHLTLYDLHLQSWVRHQLCTMT